NAPLGGIQAPIQGSTLYAGETVTVQWRAVDDSRMRSVAIGAGGGTLHSRNDLSTKNASGSFSYKVPADKSELALELTTTDVFGNSATTQWHFDIANDQ